MIRLLSMTAALALAPLSSALAQTPAPGPAPAPAPASAEAAEARMEAAAEAFEARMETFGERAEAISEDKSLSEAERGRRIAALWSDYAPDVAAFTAETTKHATEMAAQALKDIDVDAIVADALNDPEVKQAMEKGDAKGRRHRRRHRPQQRLDQSDARTDADLQPGRPIRPGPGRRRRRRG